MVDLRISVIGGSIAIALAILFVFRWEVAPIGQVGALRLDRWTGKIQICLPPHGEPAQNIFAAGGGVPYNCKIDPPWQKTIE